MADLEEWAARRWSERFYGHDDTVVAVGPLDVRRSEALQDLDRRRESLYARLGALGADADLLSEVEALEAAAGIVGIVIGRTT